MPGVRTYLSRQVVIHPGALLVEADLLKQRGVPDAFARLRLSDRALIITPFHQAANRIREIVRGADRHGSCGVGVGEAVEDALAHPADRVLAADLLDPAALRRKLGVIRERIRQQVGLLCENRPLDGALAREWEVFERHDLIDAWIASIARIGELGLVVPDALLERWLRETETVIFEGAQGVLLDADAGFHPFTTWSRCTAENAFDLIREMAPGAAAFKVGVMRSYTVRHGPGPLPTETDALAGVVSEHNERNEWQGAVRYGWFDAVLARYALEVTGGVDSLVVTHLDAVSRLAAWKYSRAYTGYQDPGGLPVDTELSDGILTGFRLPGALSLAQRAQFTQALAAVTPVLETCPADEGQAIQKIESLLGRPVGMLSRGPAAGDVRVLNPIPA